MILTLKNKYNSYKNNNNQITNLVHLFSIALPLILIQFANFSKGLVDTIMVGQFSSEHLAGMAVGSSIYVILNMFLGGFVNSNIVILSKLHAEKNYPRLHYYIHQMFYLNFTLCLIVGVILWNTDIVINMLGISDTTKEVAISYIRVFACLNTLTGLNSILRPIMQTFLKGKVLMWILISMSLLNIPLNYLFIYNFNLGAQGSAIASALCFIAEAAFVFHFTTLDKRMHAFKTLSRPNIKEMKTLFKLGYLSGFTIMAELSFTTFVVFMLSFYGEVYIAANQVVASYSNFIFMAALGLRFALMREISFLIGLKDLSAIKTTIVSSLIISVGITIVVIAIFTLFGTSIIAGYTKDVEVYEIAVGLIGASIFYQIVSMLCTSSIAILRAYHLSNYVFKNSFFGFVVIGITSSYLLSLEYGLVGFWVGNGIAITFNMIVLYRKVYKLIWKQGRVIPKITCN